MSKKSYRRPGRNPWLRLGMFSAAVGLFLFGYYWGNQYKHPEFPEVESAILLRPPVPLPDFRASDAANRPMGRQALEGHWHLLLVGATDAPATRRGLTQMNLIHNRLAEHPGLQEAVRPLLLSPAPERDTGARLGDTVQAYNPAMLAAAGTATGLGELLATLGIEKDEADPRRPATLYLLDPQVRLLALFTTDQEPAAIARDIRNIVETAPET